MKHLRRFNKTNFQHLFDTENNQDVDRIEHIRIYDLIDMCKYETKYFPKEDKEICSKFLEDNIVTDELLKLYCFVQVESVGDKYNIMKFVYDDKIIYGKFFDQDYPAKVSFDINDLNTPPKYPFKK
jgi:hypothetical protein